MSLIYLLLFTLCFTLLYSTPHWGASSSDLDQISAKARQRQYPGGVDEEELKVQETLPQAVRKADARLIHRQVFKAIFNREAVDMGPPDESVNE